CLVIVDDATHEPVAIDVERAISGQGVCRVLDRLALSRGLPKVIRTDNGKEFCGKAMVTWAHDRGVQLRLIEPGKPNQNAYVESFNGRLRDECLNEHLFTNLLHARTAIENLASRVQRGAAQESTGRPDASGLCQTASRVGYSKPGLQIRPLLKAGGRRAARGPCVKIVVAPIKSILLLPQLTPQRGGVDLAI